ncbi:hypothetical protein PoB_007033100 [Plakobranchus ocellatus]|uniref:Uncharacterized protein n=1 Tax=Plakobranchus ocellatus TaxID=259542 RepID=A0AAV4DI54_9GAST|nr:hypothetical protein PoB_007033100 [Plakobranchus ocellatus]
MSAVIENAIREIERQKREIEKGREREKKHGDRSVAGSISNPSKTPWKPEITLRSSPASGALALRRARKPEITLFWNGRTQKPIRT